VPPSPTARKASHDVRIEGICEKGKCIVEECLRWRTLATRRKGLRDEERNKSRERSRRAMRTEHKRQKLHMSSVRQRGGGEARERNEGEKRQNNFERSAGCIAGVLAGRKGKSHGNAPSTSLKVGIVLCSAAIVDNSRLLSRKQFKDPRSCSRQWPG
jgi:hypothetical protein